MNDAQPGAATVRAAQAGDQRALDELVAGYLPRAGHSDVDDVVRETMLRVVRERGRQADRFRTASLLRRRRSRCRIRDLTLP